MRFSTKNSKGNSQKVFICKAENQGMTCTPVQEARDYHISRGNQEKDFHSKFFAESNFGDSDSNYPALKVVFPGSHRPQVPDFIVLGCGATSLPLQKVLTDKGYAVLGIEKGLDQRTNNQIYQFFNASPFKGDGDTEPNALIAAWDPNWNELIGGISKTRGQGYRVDELWGGNGIGGGSLHFFAVWEKPIPKNLDGPLPPQIIPPASVGSSTTQSFVQAGGSAWSSTNVLNAIKNVEHYYGASENAASRGATGPIAVLQNGGQFNTQIAAAVTASAPLIPGGAACPTVQDTNVVPAQLNSYGPIQVSADPNTGLRSNAATGFVNPYTTVDADGNVIGTGTRKWVMWTDTIAIRVVADSGECSRTGQFVAAGVEVIQDNKMYFIPAKNVICCLGNAQSAQFWQRSGVGPTSIINKLGIPQQLNLPIGQNVQTQYGPAFHFTTNNPGFGQGFPGWGYVQYNGVPRRWTIGFLGVGTTPFGFEEQWTVDNDVYHFYALIYMINPRSRGYINNVRANVGNQPDINLGWFNDGPNPDDPASGLVVNGGSPDSDIQNCCEMLDFVSNVLAQLQSGGNPNNIQLGPEYKPSLFAPVIPGQANNGQPGSLAYQQATKNTRFPEMVPYIEMWELTQAHDSGAVVMGQPANACVDGTLKLYGSTNCFQCDKSIFPVMPASGPWDVLAGIGSGIAPNLIASAAVFN